MIDDLARAAGIVDSYTDYFGRERAVSEETKRAILAAMGLHARTNRQAARMARELRERAAQIAPVEGAELQAYVPREFDSKGIWGYGLQLYSLRSPHNWGIGDFGDLAKFIPAAAGLGADIVGLNPLHQLHLAEPAAASPYSPLSRLHLNALYIDVEGAWKTLHMGEPDAKRSDLQALRERTLVDYPAVAREKIASLRALYERFSENLESPKHADFHRFRETSGAALARAALYEALTAYYRQRDSSMYGWLQWPLPFRDPDTAQVTEFARTHAGETGFYEFLQWLACTQLRRAAHAGSSMTIGLYRDLAIGVAANSVDVWGDRAAFCLGLSIGAPPDALNTEGQNWGLPPLDPHKLRERAYTPFVQVLRANMQCAGALRIDHVMGLERLYVIPDGAPASDGAYIRYPLEDMVAVLARESRQNACMIVGEDLGTVPPGFRERMARARIFSCRLLYFESDPTIYPADAVASTGTHDLPPLLGHVKPLPAHADECAFVTATYRTLAQTPARIVLIQMEDALLRREAVNVPGTTTEQPNWRRKLPVDVEALGDEPCFRSLARAVSETRMRKENR